MATGEREQDEGGSLFPGLGALKRLGAAASNLPSDDTLNRFLDALPEITKLVSALPDEANLRALVAMGPHLQSLPSEATLRRLVDVLPALGEMPSEATLREISSMKPLLEKLPSSGEMAAMADQLEAVTKFMSALKGGG